ncbi:MAG TPA: chemotaxis protein CheD [Bryobacteraceae bacterium]|nr:chemotaxis protein CheD [Bryobacteraceae bacterium]
MSQLTVGVGDCKTSNAPESVLATYALGSCIAVAIHDPVAGVGGLLHFMLPESSLNPEKASQNPFMFADTGVPLLFRTAYGLGAEKRRLVVRVVGGAQVMDEHGVFNIGKRNHVALRKILWKAGVMVHAEEVGGNTSRTVRLEVATGRFWIRGPGMEDREMMPSSTGKGGR